MRGYLLQLTDNAMSSNCLLLRCFVFYMSEFIRKTLLSCSSSPVLTTKKMACLTGAEVFHIPYLYLLPEGLLPEILVLLGIEEGGNGNTAKRPITWPL